MQLVTGGVPFSFDYTSPLQNASLIVAAKVYKVTSGAAVFVATVPMQLNQFGSYTGNYTGTSGEVYLVICLVFTALDYATANAEFAPETFFYADSALIFYWDYTAFDQSDSLFLQSSVFDTTTGTPDILQQMGLIYVAFGVSFARFECTIGHAYQVLTPVYTDGSFDEIDPFRAPSSESFQCAEFSGSVVKNTFTALKLQGSNRSAKLRGNRNG